MTIIPTVGLSTQCVPKIHNRQIHNQVNSDSLLNIAAKTLKVTTDVERSSGESRNSEVPEPMASARSASLYWGSGGLAPSGVQGQSPLSGG